MGKAVNQERVEARIAGYDFPRRARSRIPIENNLYLFTRPVKHKPFYYWSLEYEYFTQLWN
jgi:hypothetical protein